MSTLICCVYWCIFVCSFHITNARCRKLLICLPLNVPTWFDVGTMLHVFELMWRTPHLLYRKIAQMRFFFFEELALGPPKLVGETTGYRIEYGCWMLCLCKQTKLIYLWFDIVIELNGKLHILISEVFNLKQWVSHR